MGEIEKVLSTPKVAHSRLKMPVMAIIAVAIIALCLQDLSDSRGNQFISKRKFFLENYLSPVSQVILKYGSVGESMAVWGRDVTFMYVETGIIQATRDGDIVWQVTPNPLQQYYLKRYADDLLKSNASLFIDAVTDKEKKTQAHDTFSTIAEIVRANYRLVDEVEGIRIYLKR